MWKIDVIDFIDFDGSLREVPANKEYAIHHLNPTNSYIVIKIESMLILFSINVFFKQK